jgi:hypothetical protein
MELSSTELKTFIDEFTGNSGYQSAERLYDQPVECKLPSIYGYKFSWMMDGKLLVNNLVPNHPSGGILESDWGYLNVKHFTVQDLTLQEIRSITEDYNLSINNITFDRFKELLSILKK